MLCCIFKKSFFFLHMKAKSYLVSSDFLYDRNRRVFFSLSVLASTCFGFFSFCFDFSIAVPDC